MFLIINLTSCFNTAISFLAIVILSIVILSYKLMKLAIPTARIDSIALCKLLAEFV